MIAAGPTAIEIERCLAQAEAHFLYRLQTVGGFGGKSDQLNAYNVFLGEPGFFDRDLARYRNATVADLQRRRRDLAAPAAGSCSASFRSGRTDLALGGSTPALVS